LLANKGTLFQVVSGGALGVARQIVAHAWKKLFAESRDIWEPWGKGTITMKALIPTGISEEWAPYLTSLSSYPLTSFIIPQ
jgi:hypothetical protein